jgi:general secretion pathway protein D
MRYWFAVMLFSLVVSVGAEGTTEGQSVSQKAMVNFTFEDVDIPTFVKLVGEVTGKRFVIGEGVTGHVTVVSPSVSPHDVYPLFLSIIESVGYSVQDTGGVLHVVPVRKSSDGLSGIIGATETIPDQGVYTKIFRLEHVSALAISQMLMAGKESAGGSIRALEETNHLVVTDSASGIRRVEKLIKEIDRPGLARVTDVIALTYASADEMARQLNLAMAENLTRAQRLVGRLPSGSRGATGSGTDSRAALVVAVPHSNRLIIVGTQAQVDALRELVRQMDVDVPSGHGRLNAIFLRHLSAEEAAENIGALLKQRQQSGDASATSRQIAIQPSPSSNALLVDAGPGDFEVVKRLIEQLDQSPEQVHIGVVIMEVSHGDGLQFGVELAAVDQPKRVGDTVVQGSFGLGDASGLLSAVESGIFPRGMSIGVAHGSSTAADGTIQTGFPGLMNIDAFRSNSRFKILSETSLQSQNNKEATVSVVNEIPILKSEITGGSGTARDVIQNIERMDVGIKLRITPHFIPGGRIRMALNPSIEAVIDSGSETTQFTPTIAKREVETTVTVDDGRTIVIAGLTRQDERESERRVPLLGSIPILGWLFRKTERVNERTDVLIFVTPTVVSDFRAASEHQKRWEERTGLSLDDQQ